MATFQVDLNGHSYHVEADTPEGAHAAVTQLAGGAQPEGLSGADEAMGTGEALSRGTIPGFRYVQAAGTVIGDRVGRAVNPDYPAKDQPPISYDDAFKKTGERFNEFDQAHPIASPVLQVTGAVGSPIFRGVGAGVSAVENAATRASPHFAQAVAERLFPRALGYGAQGAAAGTVAGLGNAEGADGGVPTLTDLFKTGAGGAAAGLATGFTAPYVAKGVGWGIGKVGDVAQGAVDKLPFRQDSVAARKVAENLARDNITPEQLAANHTRLGPGANVVDAAGTYDPATGTWLGGRNVRMQADTVANMPGQSADTAERVLKPRPGQAATELIGSVKSNVSPQDFYNTLDSINEQQSATAGPLFQSAFAANKSVSSPVIDKILDTPAGQEALGYAKQRMTNRMARMAVPDPELTEQYNDLVARGEMQPGMTKGGVASGLKLNTLDLVRQNLGEQMSAMRAKVARGDAKPGELQDLNDLYHDFRRELIGQDATAQAGPNSLKATGGDYENALKAYAGPARVKDAMQDGRDFMTGDREVTVKGFNTLSPSEQDAFRAGVAREINGAIENTGTVPPRLKNILNPENGTRKLLQQILLPEQFGGLMDSIGGVSRKLETARILGNSATASRQAGQADLGLDLGGAAIQGLHGNPTGAAASAGRSILNWLKMPSEGARDQMGRMLLDPNAFDQTLTALNGRAQIPNYRLLSLMSPSPAVSGGALTSLMTGPSNHRP